MRPVTHLDLSQGDWKLLLLYGPHGRNGNVCQIQHKDPTFDKYIRCSDYGFTIHSQVEEHLALLRELEVPVPELNTEALQFATNIRPVCHSFYGVASSDSDKVTKDLSERLGIEIEQPIVGYLLL